jgi:dCTP deaminase
MHQVSAAKTAFRSVLDIPATAPAELHVVEAWPAPRKPSEFRQMILSGEEIRKNLGGSIVIDPFDPANLNPNSYNLTLHDELLTYEEVVLDMRQQNRVRRMRIPQEGLVLNPNQLYLGRTVERTETHSLVPMIEGRSSIGRLGLFVHVTAGFGDVGFCGFWTLEMFAIQPVRIYPHVSICQIFYHQIVGDFRAYNSDKYQNNHDIQPSMLYKELNPEAQRYDPQLKLPFDDQESVY